MICARTSIQDRLTVNRLTHSNQQYGKKQLSMISDNILHSIVLSCPI